MAEITERDATTLLQGGCTCGEVRYQLAREPMFVNCCHCTWCQRETGSAFVINALIESSCLALLQGEPECVHTPSASGEGQDIYRCPECKVALWSHYPAAGKRLSFVRVGSFDQPSACSPQAHVFTSTKLPWVVLSDGVPAFTAYYQHERVWSAEGLERREALFANP